MKHTQNDQDHPFFNAADLEGDEASLYDIPLCVSCQGKLRDELPGVPAKVCQKVMQKDRSGLFSDYMVEPQTEQEKNGVEDLPPLLEVSEDQHAYYETEELFDMPTEKEVHDKFKKRPRHCG